MFLPENYESPKSSNNYLKLKEGETRIRIMSKPVFGWEDWLDKKPIRFRLENKPAPVDSKKPVKHFWAFIVYNYMDAQVQIMQVTQSTIRKSLESFSRDTDWGNPFEYDIKITKSGEGMETEYTVNPVPHKKISQELLDAFNEKPINLEALFEGSDPFAKNQDSYTAIMGGDEVINDDEVTIIRKLMNQLNEDSVDSFLKWIKSLFGAPSVTEIPKKAFDKCMVSLNTKIKYIKDQNRAIV